MDCETEKILVAGDVNGKFDELFKRVAKVMSTRGQFSFLIVVGNFFGDNITAWLPYKNGVKPVPIDTYILGPTRSTQMKLYNKYSMNTTNLKLCERVICLGRCGVFITDTGLKISFLSGFESNESTLVTYSEDDTLKLVKIIEEKSHYKPIDIFVTPQWPKNITSQYEAMYPSVSLQRVVKSIIPRYVVCSHENTWYKRRPYNNDEPYTYVQTRFIGLGRISSTQKWLYGIELSTNPNRPLHSIVPSPYKDLPPLQAVEEPQYRWDLEACSSTTPSHGETHMNKKLKEDSECWFCLSSPNVEKHLIVSIGKETYVALAKGGLVNNHLLISTISHMKSFCSISPETKVEIDAYKKAIQNYFKEEDCCPIFFERNLNSTQHLLIDAVPIPTVKCSLLKTKFAEFAAKYELEPKWHDSVEEFQFPSESDQYFYAELPSSEVLFIQIADKFPTFFGRHLLAQPDILNKAERVNWRLCNETLEEETELATKIKEAFKPHNTSEN